MGRWPVDHRRHGRRPFHVFALMLLAAADLALIARLPQLAIAIILVIILNVLFAFLYETRARWAAEP